MKEKALDFLNKNRADNIDMIDAILSDNADIIHASKGGVLLLNRSGSVYMHSAGNAEAAKKLFDMLPDDAFLVVTHQLEYAKMLEAEGRFSSDTPCVQYYYAKNEPFPVPENEHVKLFTLDESYIDFVMEHYTHINHREYLLGRIRDGMLGLMYDGVPAGFIGTHDDGSIGLLEILPEYRKMGLGTILELSMINHRLASGHIPYGQVEEDNAKSLMLQKKVGLEVSSDRICWNFNHKADF